MAGLVRVEVRWEKALPTDHWNAAAGPPVMYRLERVFDGLERGGIELARPFVCTVDRVAGIVTAEQEPVA